MPLSAVDCRRSYNCRASDAEFVIGNIMKPTLPHCGILSLARQRTGERRAALFRRFAAAARIQPSGRSRRTSVGPDLSPPLHSDNGR